MNITDYSLFNNTGKIDQSKPFQLLGAIPAIGSFIDICSPTLATQPIGSVSLKINWQNLPKNFETYYNAYYGYAIGNRSFKVSISILSNGEWIKAAPAFQQVNLFEATTDDTLIAQTSFPNITFAEAIVPPQISSDKSKGAGPSFTTGVIRLELSAPEYGLGSSIYPQVLNEIVLKNATITLSNENRKRQQTLLPLPHPPFVPIANSISLSFTTVGDDYSKH